MKLNETKDRDEFGASGSFKDGRFQPYPGAQTRQQEAESEARRQLELRNKRRAELNSLTIEQIKAEYPDVRFDGLTRKDDIIDKALDG